MVSLKQIDLVPEGQPSYLTTERRLEIGCASLGVEVRVSRGRKNFSTPIYSNFFYLQCYSTNDI